jgi:hypothetical protein
LRDQAPLGFGNAGGLLEQLDGVEADLRPLDIEKIIEPVECGGETLVQHTAEVARSAAMLTASQLTWLQLRG